LIWHESGIRYDGPIQGVYALLRDWRYRDISDCSIHASSMCHVGAEMRRGSLGCHEMIVLRDVCVAGSSQLSKIRSCHVMAAVLTLLQGPRDLWGGWRDEDEGLRKTLTTSVVSIVPSFGDVVETVLECLFRLIEDGKRLCLLGELGLCLVVGRLCLRQPLFVFALLRKL
jgi:hypothetical protein